MHDVRALVEEASEFLGLAAYEFLGETRKFARESQGVHPEEAAVLYSLVRALRPCLVMETGTFDGYSTAEIARALRANGSGRITTVDVATVTGAQVPEDLREMIRFVRGRPSWSLAKEARAEKWKIDLFFHDSLHSYSNTLRELVSFSRAFAPGCVVLCHDASLDHIPGFGVQKALERVAAILGVRIRILPTTCGLGLMRWPLHVSMVRRLSLNLAYQFARRLETLRSFLPHLQQR